MWDIRIWADGSSKWRNVIVAVNENDANKAKEILKNFNEYAEIIGVVREGEKVILKSPWGSKRYIELPKGELLPRIC